MGRQKTKLQYVALLFRLWVDTLPSPLKLGASRLRCFRLRPDVCAKTFSHDYIARLKAGSEISVHKQLISQLSPAIESKSVFISERGLTSTQWTEYSEHTKRVQYSTVSTSTITAEAVMVDGMVLTQTDGRGNNSECDHMGRRTIKRVMLNGNETLHQRYIYRGYLQIACIDLTRIHHPFGKK